MAKGKTSISQINHSLITEDYGHPGRIFVGSPKDLRSSFEYRVRKRYGEVLENLSRAYEVNPGLIGVRS